jgi:leucine dehydrogenase
MEHESLIVRRGARSGLALVIAIHSSKLGQPLGGCRIRHYPHWLDGAADAIRLAEGMTRKCAVTGLSNGGGKAVIVAPQPAPLAGEARRAALLDLADLIESLAGGYATGPDLGTGPDDMVTIRERTSHVFCLPAGHGGSGDSSPPTARGVLAAIRATCAHRHGTADLAGRRVTVIGLGSVGALVAGELVAAGARVAATDLDPAKREFAERLGASWLPPDAAAVAPADVLVPAAVGGLLTPELVAELPCPAIVGPANNQLLTDQVADALHAQGILWVPDYLAGAGGVIHATGVELRGLTRSAALAEVDRIGATVADLLATAARTGRSPHLVAQRVADARLSPAS